MTLKQIVEEMVDVFENRTSGYKMTPSDRLNLALAYTELVSASRLQAPRADRRQLRADRRQDHRSQPP